MEINRYGSGFKFCRCGVSLDRYFFSTLSLLTQVYKWVLLNLGLPSDRLASLLKGPEKQYSYVLHAIETQIKLQPLKTHG